MRFLRRDKPAAAPRRVTSEELATEQENLVVILEKIMADEHLTDRMKRRKWFDAVEKYSDFWDSFIASWL